MGATSAWFIFSLVVGVGIGGIPGIEGIDGRGGKVGMREISHGGMAVGMAVGITVGMAVGIGKLGKPVGNPVGIAVGTQDGTGSVGIGRDGRGTDGMGKLGRPGIPGIPGMFVGTGNCLTWASNFAAESGVALRRRRLGGTPRQCISTRAEQQYVTDNTNQNLCSIWFQLDAFGRAQQECISVHSYGDAADTFDCGTGIEG